MKKILFILLLFSLSFSVFSLEQVSLRLMYEAVDGRIRIADMYDNKFLIFRFEHISNHSFSVNCWANGIDGERVGIADIYSVDFTSFIAQYITVWSINSTANVEWRQYAALIADKITAYMRNRFPVSSQTLPSLVPEPAPGSIQIISSLQTGKHYIQTAAYASRDTALSEASKLNRNFPAVIMQTTSRINGADKTIYRILVGPLNNTESASYLQQLRQSYRDAFVWIGR